MKNIIILGMKNSGKSSLAQVVAKHYALEVTKTDDILENIHKTLQNEKLTFREIHQKYGKKYFRDLETKVIELIEILNIKNKVLDTGGGLAMRRRNRTVLEKSDSIKVFLDLDKDINFERIMKNGIPAFFKYPDNPKRSFELLYKQRIPIYRSIADVVLKVENETPEEILKILIEKIKG